MTQDNKQAALELASELGILDYVDRPNDLVNFYDAARKPLEEDNARFKRLSGVADMFDAAPDNAEFEPPHPIFMMAQENDELRQQLLQTQEAYQRVVEKVMTDAERYRWLRNRFSNNWSGLYFEPLEGEHLCLKHQGNHSHYAEHNCTVCKPEQQVAELTKQLAIAEAVSENYIQKFKDTTTALDVNLELLSKLAGKHQRRT